MKAKPKPRYLLHPGWIRSENDGQWHYIHSNDLARLYQVPIQQCVVADDSCARQHIDGLTDLYPKKSGDYYLTEPASV